MDPLIIVARKGFVQMDYHWCALVDKLAVDKIAIDRHAAMGAGSEQRT